MMCRKAYASKVLLLGLSLSMAAWGRQHAGNLPRIPTAPASSLRLRQALRLALENSPRLQKAASRVAAAQAGIAAQKARFYPSLDAEESGTRGDDPVYVFGSLLRQHRFSAQDFQTAHLNQPAPLTDWTTAIQANVLFWNGGARHQALQGAELRALEAQLGREQSRQQVLFTTLEAYAGLQAARQNARVAAQAQAAARALLRDAHARYGAGWIVKAELRRAEVFTNQAQQRARAARDAVREEAILLNVRLGRPWNTPIGGLQPLAAPSARAQQPLAYWLAATRRQGFASRQAVLGSRLARVRMHAARSRLWAPQAGGFFRLEHDSMQVMGQGGSNWMAGVSLQWNLFRGGQDAARLRQAAAQLAMARDDQRLANQQTLLATIRLWRDLRLAREQWRVSLSNRRQARSAAGVIQERYRAGLASLTQSLQAQTAETRAGAERVQALYQFQLIRARLHMMAGGLRTATILQAVDTGRRKQSGQTQLREKP